MSLSNPLGFGSIRPAAPELDKVEHVIVQRPLGRVLAFTNRTIHDVINDPIARNHVREFWKLQKWVARQSEISELERQWTGIGI